MPVHLRNRRGARRQKLSEVGAGVGQQAGQDQAAGREEGWRWSWGDGIALLQVGVMAACAGWWPSKWRGEGAF